MKKKAIVFVLAAVFAVLVAGAVFAQSNTDLATAAYNRGVAALNQGNYDLAIREFTEAIRLLPNADGPYLNRGISYFEKSDLDAAISDFTQSIRLYANNPEAYYWRGRSYYEKADYDRAITDLTQAIRLDPNDADAYYNRATSYLRRGTANRSSSDVNSAEADYNTLVRLDPNSSRLVAIRTLIDGQKRQSWYTAAAAPATGGTTPQTTTAGGNTTRANALALRLGQDQSVSFSGDESRWYSFDITQNNSALVVQTRGSVDTLLDLYDGNGNRLASDDDSGDSYNARISRTLNPGKYYVEVKNYDKKAGQSTLNAAVQTSASTTTTPPAASANMVRINGGTFTMGTPANDPQFTPSDNDPQHRVTISAFYMGKYEVTQKEYQEIMGTNPSNFKGENLPVEKVTWLDAVEYCNARSRREGLTPAYTISGSGDDRTATWNRSANGYRLPTEAEWEYACRAGTTTAYNTGVSISDNTGWYSANSGNTTHPVGQKPPNAWGLYDMHGNVAEWCWDVNGWYSFFTPTSGTQTDPVNPVNSADRHRVFRGGGWDDSSLRVRSDWRNGLPRYYPDKALGFRVARNG